MGVFWGAVLLTFAARRAPATGLNATSDDITYTVLSGHREFQEQLSHKTIKKAEARRPEPFSLMDTMH